MGARAPRRCTFFKTGSLYWRPRPAISGPSHTWEAQQGPRSPINRQSPLARGKATAGAPVLSFGARAASGRCRPLLSARGKTDLPDFEPPSALLPGADCRPPGRVDPIRSRHGQQRLHDRPAPGRGDNSVNPKRKRLPKAASPLMPSVSRLAYLTGVMRLPCGIL
jgi:hypothetical protein